MLKRGQLGGHEEGISGFAIGIVLVFIIALVAAQFWGLIPNNNKIDKTSAEYFELVYSESINVYQAKENGPNIPVQFNEDLTLAAFGKDDTVNCIGAKKPSNDECVLSACLCLCDVSAGSEMCSVKSAACQSYSALDVQFDKNKCNVIPGKDKPVYVAVNYGEEGLYFKVTESTA